MAIDTMDKLVSGMSIGQCPSIYKQSLTSKGTGYFQSLYKATGLPSTANTPSTGVGEIPTKSTVGAINFNNPSGANKLYLLKLMLACSNASTISIYDRLFHNSGLSGTVTTPQSINSSALTRYTDGLGIEMFLEIYTATGSTGVTATVSYTNELGTSGRSATASLIASPVAGQLIPFVLQQGDKGVLSIQSLTLSATTGTTGNFGITLAKKIADIPILVANVSGQMDAFNLGMPEIKPDACLFFTQLCSTTTTGTVFGSLCIAEG